jgi:mannose-6-phosphate isomerase-like protein (cupin superfamily)
MNKVSEYIESGILEMYVLGVLDEKECAEVESMAVAHEEIRIEIDEISDSLKTYASVDTEAPHPAIKPLLMATVDFSERMQAGEVPSFPPVLNENSKISDYGQWLTREDMVAPEDLQDFFVKIIGFTHEVTSAIVWIRSIAPHEVHDSEYEKFLIVEGTCDITIGDKIHSLVPGDYLSIPLHIGHHVTVTSPQPCKVILQRIAA